MKAFIEFLKLAMVLFITCAVAAGSLALVSQVTKKPIEEFAKRDKFQAMQAVQAQATEFKEVLPGYLWEAYKDGKLVGQVIAAEAQGYGGPVKMMFGIDLQEKITAVKIVSQTETPGLGAKIIQPEFTAQFTGKTIDQLALKKDDPAKGTIDAISGATISPRAVTRGLRSGLNYLLTGDATSGATPKEAK
jgi:electron transport complex protein RnfG